MTGFFLDHDAFFQFCVHVGHQRNSLNHWVFGGLLFSWRLDAQLQELFCVYVVRETSEAPCAFSCLRPERPELLDARDPRSSLQLNSFEACFPPC